MKVLHECDFRLVDECHIYSVKPTRVVNLKTTVPNGYPRRVEEQRHACSPCYTSLERRIDNQSALVN